MCGYHGGERGVLVVTKVCIHVLEVLDDAL
jgi:hypothetical protein